MTYHLSRVSSPKYAEVAMPRHKRSFVAAAKPARSNKGLRVPKTSAETFKVLGEFWP